MYYLTPILIKVLQVYQSLVEILCRILKDPGQDKDPSQDPV